MDDQTPPLLTHTCSISVQSYDRNTGAPKTFSIFGGDYGDFSSNVLKHMPPSRDAGKYQMTFDPTAKTLTIKAISQS